MIACDKCGDEPDGSPMPKAGEPCGRDLSEEVGHEPGTFICQGTYRETSHLYVVETCHEGGDMCVRKATPEEIADENRTHDGWAMSLADARRLAIKSVRDFNAEHGRPGKIPMRFYDFSEEPS